jgi:hypothetical protein
MAGLFGRPSFDRDRHVPAIRRRRSDMTRTFITRLQILAAVLAGLAVLAAAGLVTPASAEAASQGRCSVTRTAAGDPASFRVTCDAVRPTPTRPLGTAIPRRGKTCTIAHLGALDPAAFRPVC